MKTTNTTTPAQKAAATRKVRRHAKNTNLALTIAEAWHRNVKPLYLSGNATVTYGAGTHPQEEYGVYSKAWHRSHGPARWVNAGVTRDPSTGLVTIYPVRGRPILLDTPRSLLPSTLAPTSALLDGDVWGTVDRNGTVTRYDLNSRPTGVAVRVSPPSHHHWWEHGATVEECRKEAARKILLNRARARENAARDREYAVAHAAANREAALRLRRARLVLALCRRAVATVEDARALGYCAAGIRAFRERHGLTTVETVPLRVLVRTGNPQAVSLARHLASTLSR